jgi:multidrug resistance protein, MATE family
LSSATAAHATWGGNLSRIAHLAWPVFIGQLSVLAFSTVDTLLVARHSPLDLAALAVGAAAYVTIFIGFMGVVLAISPIVGQQFGAGHLRQAGQEVHQATWVALGLSVLGVLLLVFPQPFLLLAHATDEVAQRVRGYLLALAFSLPAALLFTVYRGFNVAISRPRAVMALQLLGLGIKLPMSAALVFGVPALGIPSMGVVGCGIATAVAMWAQVLLAARVLRQDRFYEPYALWGQGLARPELAALRKHLKLGIPMGLSILVEVTAFSFMAIFIARLGTTAVAGHQIAANLVALLFMAPLAIGNASSTLVAQRLGANDLTDARLLGWHGLTLGVGLAVLMGLTVLSMRVPIVNLYSGDLAVAAAAVPLVAWIAAFHVADALQAIAAFVLRAYQVAKIPLAILALSLWGIGLGGGYGLAFGAFEDTPVALRNAQGFWAAATLSLVVAGVALCAYLVVVVRRVDRAGQLPTR